MKVAVCQMNVVQGDQKRNRITAERMILEAAENDAKVVILPEMWTSGYDFNNLDKHKEIIGGSTYQFLSSKAKNHNIWIIGGSFPVEFPEGIKNTSFTFDPNGDLQNIYNKVHLIGLMNEDEYLVPGSECTLFNFNEHLAAVEICYDIRFPELTRTYAISGAKILFVPAEWPVQREEHWKTLLQARAIENQMFVIGANIVGNNDNDIFNGKSMIIDPRGQIIAEAGSKPVVLYGNINLSLVKSTREAMPIFKDRMPSVYKI